MVDTIGKFDPSNSGPFIGTLSVQLPYRQRDIKKTVTVAGEPDTPPSYGVPTIQDGIAIPYICGQQRIFNPIVSWYGNLTPVIEVKKELTSSEVEEVFSSEGIGKKEVITTDTITVTTSIVGWKLDVQMVLCLGPGVDLIQIYQDEEPVAGSHSPSSADKKKIPPPFDAITFHNGNYDQPRDADLVSWCGAKVPAYVGICYVVLKGLNVTDRFPALSFEVRRRPNPLGLTDNENLLGNDINVSTAIYDWLVNDWGACGLPAKAVDKASFIRAAQVARSELNASSIYVQQKTSGSNVLKEYERHLRSYVFFNPETALVETRLFRPPVDPSAAFELNDKNIVDKPKLGKTSWETLPNKLPVTYTNRKKSYEEGTFSIDMPVDDTEPKKIQAMGYPLAHTYGVAQRLATRDSPYVTQPLWEVRVEVNRSASHLKPGDHVVFRWPDYRLQGVLGVVTSRNEEKDTGIIGLVVAPIIGPQVELLVEEDVTQIQSVATDMRPVPPQEFWAISAPFWMVSRSGINMNPEGYIDFDVPLYVVRAGGPTQRKYDIFQKNSPLAEDEWARRDRNRSYAIVGKLQTAIGAYDGWEDGILPELLLKNVPREDTILSSGLTGVRQGQSFLVIGDEIMAFEGATKTGDTSWTLTNVHRALFGRAFRSHEAGDKVAILSNDWGCIGKTSYRDTDTPHLKAVSWGLSAQENPITGGLEIQNVWDPTDQLNAPYRPDNTRVQLQRSATPVDIQLGEFFDFEFSPRNRSVLKEVPLMTDSSHPNETNANARALYTIILLDSDNVEHVLDETEVGGYIPLELPSSGIALGLGYIFVRVTFDLIDSLYEDRVPVNVIA